jgi:hypothetical protein
MRRTAALFEEEGDEAEEAIAFVISFYASLSFSSDDQRASLKVDCFEGF